MTPDTNLRTFYFQKPWFWLFIICGFFLIVTPVISGETLPDQTEPALINFRLVDTEQYSIDHVSLMKAGEYNKDGQSHQYQNIEFSKESGELHWNPCNDNSCSIVSQPTSGGTTGRDELILEVFEINPSVNVDSCYGDTTCERLKGRTRTISGMIEGFFKTGKTYEISIASLKPGIRESFLVTEVHEN